MVPSPAMEKSVTGATPPDPQAEERADYARAKAATDRMLLRLDLSGVPPGQAVFKIGPEMFNVPRQTDVARISPSQIVLDIDRIAERQVPIHVNVQGQPAAGYRVASAKANPSAATVRGPSRFVFHTDSVQTTPVEVNGAKADVAQPVILTPPSERVTITGPQAAEAMVSVDEIIADREFRGLPVEVRDTGPGVAAPERLFQPFQTGAESSGLGLYISRAFARAFEGDLRYESEPGGRWCFALYLTPFAGWGSDGETPKNEQDQDSADRRPHAVPGSAASLAPDRGIGYPTRHSRGCGCPRRCNRGW